MFKLLGIFAAMKLQPGTDVTLSIQGQAGDFEIARHASCVKETGEVQVFMSMSVLHQGATLHFAHDPQRQLYVANNSDHGIVLRMEELLKAYLPLNQWVDAVIEIKPSIDVGAAFEYVPPPILFNVSIGMKGIRIR